MPYFYMKIPRNQLLVGAIIIVRSFRKDVKVLTTNEYELTHVTGGQDELKHGLCVAHYACFTAFLHPDQGNKGPCWSDYNCVFFEK